MEYILSPKSEFLFFLSKQQCEFLSNDSLKFFQDYEDLIDILHQINNQGYNIFKFIYYYRKNIHPFLYECDINIKVNEFKLKLYFAELFYLDLLIVEDETIMNYIFDFDLLLNIYNKSIKNFEVRNKDLIYKIVICKILLDLIKNFCDSEYYNINDNEEQIAKINDLSFISIIK